MKLEDFPALTADALEKLRRLRIGTVESFVGRLVADPEEVIRMAIYLKQPESYVRALIQEAAVMGIVPSPIDENRRRGTGALIPDEE